MADGVAVTAHTQELVLTLITRLRHDADSVATVVLTQRGIIVVSTDGRSTWHRYEPRVPADPPPPHHHNDPTPTPTIDD